jgi:DNA polymerase-3 subunit delta'
MSLIDIKGQALAVKLLKKAISTGKIAHSYLFYGPQGVGKEYAAREFAKVLNCPEKSGDSCDKCSSCNRIGQNKHPDIMWVSPGGKSRVIKIEQIRKIQDFLSWKPYEGKVKVCVVIDAHTLKIEAGNALLKTLEEPPKNSVLILVTDSPELLLPTIRSRMQGVRFSNLPQNTVAEILEEKIGLEKKEAFSLAELSTGSVCKAMNFKDENMSMQRKSILNMLSEGSLGSMKGAVEKVEEIQSSLEQFKDELIAKINKESISKGAEEENLSDDNESQDEDAFVAGEHRRRIQDILNLILSWYRDILVYKTTQKEKIILNRDYKDKIVYWSAKYSEDELVGNIEVIDDVRESLARQINFKFLFQVMFVKLGLI